MIPFKINETPYDHVCNRKLKVWSACNSLNMSCIQKLMKNIPFLLICLIFIVNLIFIIIVNCNNQLV